MPRAKRTGRRLVRDKERRATAEMLRKKSYKRAKKKKKIDLSWLETPILIFEILSLFTLSLIIYSVVEVSFNFYFVNIFICLTIYWRVIKYKQEGKTEPAEVQKR